MKKFILLFVGGLLILTISNDRPAFSAEKKASSKQVSKGTASTQILKESPMDKALIGLWQAIEVINKVVMVCKGDKITYLMTPRGAITTNRPMFEWSPVTNVREYRFRLWQGGNTREDTKTTAPKFTYPESKEGLPPGTYTWKVEILIGKVEEGNFSEAVTFKIISAKERLQLEKELQPAKELLATDYIFMASIYLKHLFFNEAILNFQKAIDISPDNPYAHLGLAKSYNAIGKEANVEWEKAISIFNRLITITPDNPDLHAGLAVAYKAIREIEKAQNEWEKAKGSKAYHYHLLR